MLPGWRNAVDHGEEDGHEVGGRAVVSEGCSVYGDAAVIDIASVNGIAEVLGNAKVTGCANISADAVVESDADYAVYRNQWSSFRDVTYTKSNGMWRAGCFLGTGDELIAKARKDGRLSGKCYAEIVRCQKRIEAAMASESETFKKHKKRSMD